MNAFHYYLSPLNLIPILTAAAIVFGMFYVDKTRPGSPIVAFVRHRDRAWFAVMLLLIPFIVSRSLFSFFRPVTLEEGMALGIISRLLSGVIFGIAACLVASPGKKPEPLSFWMAFIVAVVLILFFWAISTVAISFRNQRGSLMSFIFVEGVLVLCYFIWRMAQGNKPDASPEAPVPDGEGKKNNPGRAFLWLLVALAPIPLLLITVSASGPNPALGQTILILSPICCLIGGIGCLSSIRNMAVRIILGLFLACFFFGLSLIVALFEACSHSGGI